ncbi:MAG: hypothetical protein ACI9DJ_002660, partial [Algoriphagus sp.]
MKKILSLLTFILVPFLLTAQSVLITPGAQSLNGDSTNQNQLTVYGNGLLVGPKVKFTAEDPASNVHTMNCATSSRSTSIVGTLKDPSGDADYTGGLTYSCNFRFYTYDPLFVAYQIDFESLDTEADGDTVSLWDLSTGESIGSYSGNSLPPSLKTTSRNIRVRFITDSDANVGAGFVLKWKALLSDGTPTSIQNYAGEGLVYDVASHSLWAGKHSLSSFKNKGVSSTAMGASTIASGPSSTAMGHYTKAFGDYSTAMGSSTEASGDASTAMGSSTEASGRHSTAMGYYTKAFGRHSTAMGYDTKAFGLSSTAMGSSTLADSTYATAMGRSTRATGYASTAMGSSTLA